MSLQAFRVIITLTLAPDLTSLDAKSADLYTAMELDTPRITVLPFRFSKIPFCIKKIFTNMIKSAS